MAQSRTGVANPAKAADRIRVLESKAAASPGDRSVTAALISAYLQKLRETADGTYLELASRLTTRLIQQDGGSVIALRFQNEVDLQRHEFKAVAERAGDMVKYEPSDPGLWGNLGDALMELGEYERAGQAYTRMRSLRSGLASLNRAGYHRFVIGDAGGAIAFLTQAIEAGGDGENTAWCWAELGDMYFKTGAFARAEKAYNAGLALFPGLHRAYAGLGQVHAERKQFEEAIRNYERALAMVPMIEYAGALENLYESVGQVKKAETQRRLIETIATLGRAGKEQTNRTLVLILANHGRDLNHALELIQTEIPIRGSVYTWDALSWVLFKLGRIPEARAASLKAIRMMTPEPDFYLHATQIADASGDVAEAAKYRERQLALRAGEALKQ